MNEIERAEIDAEHDGYRNEWQRAAAWSSINKAPNPERAKALALVADGLHVAVTLSPVYCPVTDAVIGEYVTILAFGDDRAALLDAVNRDGERTAWDADTMYQIWPLSRPSAPALAPAVTDEVPF
jgi:transposase